MIVGRLAHLLTLLGVNLVPAAGWFVAHWSAGTTLLVYWIENVVGCAFVVVRILAHQRMSPCRGHFRYLAPATDRRARRTGRGEGSYLRGFLVVAVAFSIGHALFLGVILGLLAHNGETLARVDWRSAAVGCGWVIAFLCADLAVDLTRLRTWSFRRVELEANRSLGRLAVVHLTLIFGLAGVAVTGAPSALFGVFVVLKTLFAVGTALPSPDGGDGDEIERRRRNEEPVSRPGSRDRAAP